MPPSKTLGNGSKLLITTSRHLRRVRNNTIIKDQFRDFITASLLCPRGERSYIFSTLNPLITDTFYGLLRGCLHDTGASSLRFPLMALYLFTWYHQKMSCRRESPRGEFTPVLVPGRELNFTPVRNLAAVSCKRQTTTRLERVAHAYCLGFWITCVFYQHEVYHQITRYEMTQSSCKREYEIKKLSRYETRAGASFFM